MTDRVFVDSNVWIYLFSHDDDYKRETARRFIAENGANNILVVSHQVINEVSNILVKRKLPEPDVRNTIEQMSKICMVQNYSKEISIKASNIREIHSFSFWDSHIMASAISSKCRFLVSEDMQDGQVLDGTNIMNIFTNG
jgi:predicted nucleic acid-binding protein